MTVSRIAAFIALWFAALSAVAAELPAIMLLTGSIYGTGSVAPAAGDRVLAFANNDGRWIGDGTVSAAGVYSLLISSLASFNGSPVVFELQQGRHRYALLGKNGATWLPFAGRLLPERSLLDLTLGPQTAELGPAEVSAPQAQRLARRVDVPCTEMADVNEDGRCDEADWVILRRYAGGISRTVARP